MALVMRRVCPQCGNAFEKPHHPEQRFCSNSCSMAARWKRTARTAAQECQHCGKPYRRRCKDQVYCSRHCRTQAYNALRAAAPKRDPWAWDGKQREVVVKCDYRLSCKMCGEARDFKLTRERAELLRKAGLFGQCGRCGSSILEFESDQGVRQNVAHLLSFPHTAPDNWETRVDAEMGVP